MDIEFIKMLSSKIALHGEAYNKAISLLENEPQKLLKISNKTTLKNSSKISKAIFLNKANGAVLSLAVSLILLERAYFEYKKREIPDEIFLSSMSDIAIWVNTAKIEENIDGLLEFNWLRHTLFLNLFRIGRLQFQFEKTNYLICGVNRNDVKNAPIKNREPVLSIHIPEDGKLILEDCEKSISDAKVFFKKYYPKYDFKGFICNSWLLDPKNKEFMSESSNIIHFSKLFDTVYSESFTNTELVKRLWGKNTYDLAQVKDFPVNTDLEKRAKDYILKGNKTGNGYGLILI
ncbi:MAG: acyltransferase domain-containing protein [Oscillospiraceae bacterium]